MSRSVLWFLFIWPVLALASCTAAGQPVQDAVDTAVATPGATPAEEENATSTVAVTPITATVPIIEVTMPVSPTIPIPTEPTIQRWVVQAQEDLARRLNVTSGQIEVVAVEMVTWSDSSLGCPQPGMAYIQVPQDGLLIPYDLGLIPAQVQYIGDERSIDDAENQDKSHYKISWQKNSAPGRSRCHKL